MSTAAENGTEQVLASGSRAPSTCAAPDLQALGAGVEEKRRGAIPILFHVAMGAFLGAMLLIGRLAPGRYIELVQEDRVLEWGTVGLFLAAAFIGLRHAIRERRAFDGLVALFCLFVGGEEFSWGQRLLGFNSPEYFLGHNVQQELNIHNIVRGNTHETFLSLALAGYGILLPFLSDYARARRPMARAGATPPPFQLAPWFIILIALMVWSPLSATNEWVEFVAGGLFLAASWLLGSTKLSSKSVIVGLSFGLVFGYGMMKASDALERGRDIDRVSCASVEIRALLNDIIHGKAATEKLLQHDKSEHKRIWTLVRRGYLDEDRIRELKETRCSGPAAQSIDVRHQYAVDPWGTSYWLLIQGLDNGDQRLTVYSFGPNRRRDGMVNSPGEGDIGDDIAITGILPNPDVEINRDEINQFAPFSMSFDP